MTDALATIGAAMRAFWECQRTARDRGRIVREMPAKVADDITPSASAPLPKPYSSPFGTRYDQASFETARPTDCIQIAKEFNGGCLVLSGPTGCGKTFAAACITRREKERDAQGVFLPRAFTASGIFSQIKFSDDRLYHIDRMKTEDLTILDDLGTEAQSDFVASVLDDVLNHRYSHNLPTVITTNLSGKAFAARYGERIVDRLREWGTFFESRQKSMRAK